MKAKRSFGQNFLEDRSVIEKIVDAARLEANDSVIEIGPGLGALTEPILARAGRVFGVEADEDLHGSLARRFAGSGTFQLISADALTLDLARFDDREPLKVVANLPYNISTPILQRLIDERHRFTLLVLMFQREVVERISAPAGVSEHGYLSVLAQDAFAIERMFDVPPTAFRPAPKVWSSVVRLTPRASMFTDEKRVRRLLSVAFAQKRKTLQNNLKGLFPRADLILHAAGIDPSRRAETLMLDEWQTLATALHEQGTED